MPLRTIPFSPDTTNWKKVNDAPSDPGQLRKWFLNNIGETHKNIVDDKSLKLFKSVAFRKEDILDLLDQDGVGWLVFSLMKIEKQHSNSFDATFMVFGQYDTNEEYMLKDYHKMYIGTHLNKYDFSGNVQGRQLKKCVEFNEINTEERTYTLTINQPLFDFIKEDSQIAKDRLFEFASLNSRDVVYEWDTKIGDLEVKPFSEVVLEENLNFKEKSLFFFVRISKSALETVLAIDPNCQKIALIPVPIECNTKINFHDVLGSNRWANSIHDYITCFAVPLNSNDKILPINDSNKTFYYSSLSWEPIYKNWTS